MPTSKDDFRTTPAAVITCGDPAGIGTEIVLKAVQRLPFRKKGALTVIGSGAVLHRTERLTGLSLPKTVRFIDLQNVGGHFSFGSISASYGRSAFEYIQEAIRLLKREEGYLVTAPLHKSSLKKAGFSWPGHTEMLKALTGAEKVNMMFAGKKFCLSLVTWHISIRDLPRTLSKEKVLDAVFLLDGALKRYFLKPSPHIGLSALNPHGGEGGLFGEEEKKILLPALKAARRRGIDVVGPFPPDSLFYEAYRGTYDGVVALYHDQGLIPFKMIERSHGVNVTLGLPFVRTSPDHGTAFDIAGKNRADPRSMIEAILLGRRMALTQWTVKR